MRFFKVLCVLAVALCLAGSVYAETQSVKVSGDLTVRGIFRDQYDYQGHPEELPTDRRWDHSGQSWAMSVAEVEVDADLTDNVQTVIRILNQRDWNVYDKDLTYSTTHAWNGRGGYAANPNEFNVMLDLAYVNLKNFIYSPLTLTIGRQDLWFGRGFIVGANMQNPGAAGANFQGGNLSAPEYTAINSFDAVKAVLDYDPWTITGIMAVIYEDAIQSNDDVNLYGVNVGYKFNKYKAEAEAYWFWKNDKQISVWNGNKKNSNDVQTLGLRGSLDPIDVVTIALEGAYQGGEYIGNRNQAAPRNRSAWALDVMAECRYLTSKFAWKPKVGFEYIYYSGDKDRLDSKTPSSGMYTGWDPMYRGKFDSAIREFVGRFYTTARYGTRSDDVQTVPDSSLTNQHQIIFMGSIQPVDTVTLKANYNLFWNQYAYNWEVSNWAGASKQQKMEGWVGQELDLNLTWDYTEDVSFGLLYGIFVPGSVYTDHLHDPAQDLVGTVKVSF